MINLHVSYDFDGPDQSAQSDEGPRCPLSETLGAVEYLDEERRLWSACANAQLIRALLFAYGIALLIE